MTTIDPRLVLAEGPQLLRDQIAAGAGTVGQGPDVFVEVWVLYADPTGAYLLSQTPDGEGGPWLVRLPAWAGKGGYHAAVQGLLDLHAIPEEDWRVLHSTGWRPEDEGLMLPYVAVVGAAGDDGAALAYTRFPTEGPRQMVGLGARPVGKPLYDAKGGPRPHGATERPTARYLDQLWNCLEHLRHLRDHNQAVRRALDHWWQLALEDWQAVLGGAGLYGTWVRDRTGEREVTTHVRA
jgi:hypothetical protein